MHGIFGLGASILCSNSTRFQRMREGLKVKFDITYFITTETLPYIKYPNICELEVHHAVKIGTSYRHEDTGKYFMHYIADAKWHDLLQNVTKVKFSLLLDGFTDKGNIDNKILLAVWCDPNRTNEKVHTRMDYFLVS